MFGVGFGPSKDEQFQAKNLTAESGFATNLGEKDLTASSDFMNAILSGDATKTMQALAPQVSAAKTSAQQGNKTTAEFGNRGGGTGAATAATNDKVHSDITNLIGSLTGGAASHLGSMGSNALGMGMSGTEAGFDMGRVMQQQNQSRLTDLFRSIGDTVGSVAGFKGVPKGVSQDLNATASIFG